VCSVTNEGNAPLGGYPRGQRVTEDQLPIYECFWGSRADDGVNDGSPVFDGADSIFNVAGGGPGFFDVCFVLSAVR
jgi:hypothetical protein